MDGNGLSSYPHPWLRPDFWQFPTVSMGLGPIQAIYQARFMKYLHHRGIANTEGRKVWCFCGDGEMDEPESLGAIALAARENLDNLIFVINCNLQRLDGPVRGNGKIIQEPVSYTHLDVYKRQPYYLIQNVLIGVMAQRLVRTLCPHCKSRESMDEALWLSLIHI